MTDRIPTEKWFPQVVELLLGALIVVGVRVTGGNSPIISGGLVFAAVCLVAMWAYIFRRAERPERRHQIAYVLVPTTFLAVVFSIDLEYVAENGIAFSVVGLAGLAGAGAVLLRRG